MAVLKVGKGKCDMEVSALARLSKHASLVRFYGLATDGIDFDYLITELAPRGASPCLISIFVRLLCFCNVSPA